MLPSVKSAMVFCSRFPGPLAPFQLFRSSRDITISCIRLASAA